MPEGFAIDPALVADAFDAAPRPTVMLRMEGAPVQDPPCSTGCAPQPLAPTCR